MKQKTKVAVLGATGFTGEKLVEILIDHPAVELTYLSSHSFDSVNYASIFPKLQKKIDIVCHKLNIDDAIAGSDFFFLALPHTVSMQVAPKLIAAGKKVIDLSADYRLHDTKVYEKFYHAQHLDPQNLPKAIYGLPELFGPKIKQADLVANPGCYASSIILALAPLAKQNIAGSHCIIDAKSSISGAGKKLSPNKHYMHVNNNLWAYKPFLHQHLPEIDQTLNSLTSQQLSFTFVPHVVGVESGIYSTIYLKINSKITQKQIAESYQQYAKENPFIRYLKPLPQLKDVVGTNFCDIGFSLETESNNLVVVSCIDNLIKGAAGMAVQNMNIMADLPQTEGLI
jgi:N-acetyl-gamma-glutamyl-phosphate reductase